MQKADYTAYRALKDVGWDVDKRPSVRPHRGHETRQHFLCKAISVWLAVEQGMRVSTEVPIHDSYTADVLVHGNDEVAPFVIEFETACDEAVRESNLNTYMIGPVTEVFTIALEDAPEDPDRIEAYLQQETWL